MRTRTEGTGWADFAAVVLAIAGFLNAAQGISALLSRAFFQEENMVVGNLPAWGVSWIVLGVAQIGAASLLVGREVWGRRLGILFASLSIIDSFVSLDARPIWNLTVIALDLLIIHGLATHPEAFDHEPVEEATLEPVRRGTYGVYQPPSMTQSMPMMPH